MTTSRKDVIQALEDMMMLGKKAQRLLDGMDGGKKGNGPPPGSEPRRFRPDYGWPVDLARDSQGNCKSCNAPIYWVEIVTKKGEIKKHPLSEALSKRDGEQVYLNSHYSDCPNAKKYR